MFRVSEYESSYSALWTLWVDAHMMPMYSHFRQHHHHQYQHPQNNHEMSRSQAITGHQASPRVDEASVHIPKLRGIGVQGVLQTPILGCRSYRLQRLFRQAVDGYWQQAGTVICQASVRYVIQMALPRIASMDRFWKQREYSSWTSVFGDVYIVLKAFSLSIVDAWHSAPQLRTCPSTLWRVATTPVSNPLTNMLVNGDHHPIYNI